MTVASIPSPSDAVWEIGPLPIRAYALCIIAGVVVAIWLGERRWVARGGRPGTVGDMAVWAIPFGLVGARLYHVATNPELYFSGDGRPIEALYIWEGGLGIWGAIALGAVGAYIGCRRAKASFAAMADTMAPGILFGQAIGRWGNWFNQELFGKPTDKPWGLEIDPEHRPPGYEQYDTFQPTYLYESIWVLIGGFVLLWIAKRYQIGYGRIMALYVMIYTAGRGWIEALRIDDAHHFLGLRLNVWTSIVLFCLALAYFVWMGRRHPGREEVIQEWDDPEAAGRDDAESAAEVDAEGESTVAASDDAEEESTVSANAADDAASDDGSTEKD
ncbi:prolipoprotein diacylglyceryl transferase [Solicola gregarius]|uniref:Phosphatidylglycerol--prolipoprotein diacylglyceryl transferase n=1 Tax=Solicola gregarius TaxID=2908642 RepID=A0AA46TIV6_9ACTN|nr:prolipoprotein diacylglyceryl transferase [Solicola gregarius]UYM05318.1 prolipoprotein diacylglyceryl transferase [Solicola gregarius]